MQAEAAQRRSRGTNAIPERRTSLFGVLLRQFASPFDMLLTGVGVLALFLRQATDASIVLAIAIVLTLPLTPVAGTLGFSPLTTSSALMVGAIIFSYAVTIEIAKLLFFRRAIQR